MEPGAEFHSFDELNTAIEEFCTRNNVLYVIGDSRTVETANKKLSTNGVRYETKFKYSYVKFICKHSGQAKSTSTGIRPNQRSYKTGCQSFIMATANRVRSRLEIVKTDFSHNHDTSEDIFMHYPEQRRVTKEQGELVKTLTELSVAPSAITKHFFERHGKCMNTKDVNNIKRREQTSNKLGAVQKAQEEDLLEVIDQLRAQVTSLQAEVSTLQRGKESHEVPSPDKPGKKKKKKRKKSKDKPERQFDFSRFNKRHIALRIAYLGWDFHGFAAQENINSTIEYHLFEALQKTKLIRDRPSCNYSRCGRTDKGVSAFGQVITLDARTNLSEGEGVIASGTAAKKSAKKGEVEEVDYVTILNRVLPPEIRVLAWAAVNPSFSARFNCQYRTYKYFFPRGNLDIDLMRLAAVKLLGEHDFRNFCKMDVANGVVTFIRRIVSIDIQPLDDRQDGFQMYEVTVSGFAFLYHQVRCMVAVLFLVGQHKEKPEIIDELLDVSRHPCKPQYSMAAEGPLVLYDCGFEGLTWIYDDDNQKQNIKQLQSTWTNHCIRATIVKRMLDGLDAALVPENESAAAAAENRLVPWEECRETIARQSERLIMGLPSSTHQPLLKRNVGESLEDRIAHFAKKGRGVKRKRTDISQSESTGPDTEGPQEDIQLVVAAMVEVDGRSEAPLGDEDRS